MSNLGQLFDKPGEGKYTSEYIRGLQKKGAVLNPNDVVPGTRINEIGAEGGEKPSSGDLSMFKEKRRDRTFDGGKGLRYPLDRIERDSDYLEIKVLEYQPPGFEARGTGQSLALQTSSESLKNNEVILGHIFLPIPESITDSNGVTWGTDSLNGLAAAGLGIGLKTMGAPSLGAAGKALTSGD